MKKTPLLPANQPASPLAAYHMNYTFFIKLLSPPNFPLPLSRLLLLPITHCHPPLHFLSFSQIFNLFMLTPTPKTSLYFSLFRVPYHGV